MSTLQFRFEFDEGSGLYRAWMVNGKDVHPVLTMQPCIVDLHPWILDDLAKLFQKIGDDCIHQAGRQQTAPPKVVIKRAEEVN